MVFSNTSLSARVRNAQMRDIVVWVIWIYSSIVNIVNCEIVCIIFKLYRLFCSWKLNNKQNINTTIKKGSSVKPVTRGGYSFSFTLRLLISTAKKLKHNYPKTTAWIARNAKIGRGGACLRGFIKKKKCIIRVNAIVLLLLPGYSVYFFYFFFKERKNTRSNPFALSYLCRVYSCDNS